MIVSEVLSIDGATTPVAVRKGERLLYRAEPIDGFDGHVLLTNDVRLRGAYEPVMAPQPIDAFQQLPAVPYLTSYRLQVIGRTQGSVRLTLERLPKILKEYSNREGRGVMRITEGGLELGDVEGGLFMGADGDVRLRGSAVSWDDSRFPAAALNPPGPVQAPSVDPDTGLLVFSNNQSNVTGSLDQMTHRWVEGSEIRPHVHWVQEAPGNVVWQLEYRLLPAVDGPFPTEWTVLTASQTTHTYPGGSQVMITQFPPIDMTGFQLSAMNLFKLSRLGSDPADTLDGDVKLLEFDVHLQIDGFGSNQEFVR